jgi:heptosyltransferase-2
VLAPNWLGDAVMSLPALADVRRRHPDAHLVVAVRAGLNALFEAVAGVNEIVALEGRWRADARALAAGHFDAALLLPNSFRAAWTAWRAAIPERWGYRRDLRSLLLSRAIAPPRAGRSHHSTYYQQLTTALDCPAGPLQPALTLSPAMQEAGDRVLRSAGWTGERLVGLAPGAAYGSAKRWPPDRVGQLARELARDGIRPVLVGAGDDVETAREVVRSAERAGLPMGALIDLAGRTSLGQLIGIVSRCAAFVSNDSGAMHLAAALDVPVTAIFGPTQEWATAPLAGPAGHVPAIVRTDVFCRPCMLRTCPIDHRCMRRIDVGAVLTAVSAQLRDGGAAA